MPVRRIVPRLDTPQPLITRAAARVAAAEARGAVFTVLLTVAARELLDRATANVTPDDEIGRASGISAGEGR